MMGWLCQSGVGMGEPETDKVKLAKLILRITGIDRVMNAIISHCQCDDYEDEIHQKGFQYYKKEEKIDFLRGEQIYGNFGFLSREEYIRCSKYYCDGFSSIAFYEFGNCGFLHIKFIMNVQSSIRRDRYFNLFSVVEFENCDKWEKYKIRAYTQPILTPEEDVSPTLLWMNLLQE